MTKKQELSGMRLEMMTPGIEFGVSRTTQVMANMHKAAAAMDPDAMVFTVNRSEVITAGDIVQALDTYFPEEDGIRKISGHLNLDDTTLVEGERRPLEVMARIQGFVWMKLEDELTDLLGEDPKDIWHAIQYMEYTSLYEPVDPDEKTDAFARGALIFENTGNRIKVTSMSDDPQGDLVELVSLQSAERQFFALFDDNSITALRGKAYAVVEPDEPDLDDDPSMEM